MFLDPVFVSLPNGGATVVMQVFEEMGHTCAGVYFIEGYLDLPPKAWVRTVRQELANIEKVAAESGCHEMRVCGRDWSKILTDYEPLPGSPNGLRKVLHNGR